MTRVIDTLATSVSLRYRKMLEGRLPVVPRLGALDEVLGTAQLFGTEALGHPTPHLGDVAELCRLDEDARDTETPERLGHSRTSHRVQPWSRHTKGYRPRPGG